MNKAQSAPDEFELFCVASRFLCFTTFCTSILSKPRTSQVSDISTISNTISNTNIKTNINRMVEPSNNTKNIETFEGSYFCTFTLYEYFGSGVLQ